MPTQKIEYKTLIENYFRRELPSNDIEVKIDGNRGSIVTYHLLVNGHFGQRYLLGNNGLCYSGESTFIDSNTLKLCLKWVVVI